MICEWAEEKVDGFYHCVREGCKGKATKRAARRRCDLFRTKKLGDRVAAVLTKVGMKKCGGCRKRQKLLNKLDDAVRGWLKPPAP